MGKGNEMEVVRGLGVMGIEGEELGGESGGRWEVGGEWVGVRGMMGGLIGLVWFVGRGVVGVGVILVCGFVMVSKWD